MPSKVDLGGEAVEVAMASDLTLIPGSSIAGEENVEV